MIRTIFWNSLEQRLRAGWRLGGQFVLMIILSGLLNSVIPAIIGLRYVIAHPGEDMVAATETVTQTFRDFPLLSAANQFLFALGILLSVWVAGRWLDRRPFASFGVHLNRRWWIDLGFGLFLGAILMTGIFLVELAAGWLTITGTLQHGRFSFGMGILLGIINFIGVGVNEEFFSRGYMLRNLAEGFNFSKLGARGALWVGYFFSSAVFGLLHLGNANATWVSTFNIMVAGLLLGAGYVLTGELAIPIGIHITWNFFQGYVFGLPVSGSAPSTNVIAIQQGGPEFWTGGAFGPEAGMLGLLACLLGCMLIAVWVRWRNGRAELQVGLAEYTSREIAKQ